MNTLRDGYTNELGPIDWDEVMTTKVNFPKTGMGIEEGTVVRWLKSVGDTVRKGESIVEIETAKALQDIAAPVDGTLSQITAAAGTTVPVNTTLAWID
jgi:pyruvate/2-oxoglutarate dehydrogenase complex dihydrolipoamide acyltransferase (E2) component